MRKIFKSRVLVVALIAVILFSSFCVHSSGKKTESRGGELLKVTYLEILPSTVVDYNQDITIRVQVENIGEDPAVLLLNRGANEGNGSIALYEICEPVFRVRKFSVSTNGEPEQMNLDLNYDGETESIYGIKLKPHDFAMLTWNIEVPSREEVFGLTTECTFKIRIAYWAIAETDAYIYFATPEELATQIYTQKDMPLAGNNIATHGPVMVRIDAPHQPYPAGPGEEFTLAPVVENIGNGITEILGMNLTVYKGFKPLKDEQHPENDKCRYFYDIERGEKRTLILQAPKDMIRIYKKRTARFPCVMETPQDVQHFQYFHFKAYATYVYSVIVEKTIKVKELY